MMPRLTYARVCSVLALVIAATGTALAAGLPGQNAVRSSDIKNGEVKRPDIGTSAVTGKAIAAGAVDGRALEVFEEVEKSHGDASADDMLYDNGPILYAGPGFVLRGDCRIDGGIVHARVRGIFEPGTAFEYATLGDADESGGGDSGGTVDLFTVSGTPPSSGLVSLGLKTSAGASLTGDLMIGQTPGNSPCAFRLHMRGT